MGVVAAVVACVLFSLLYALFVVDLKIDGFCNRICAEHSCICTNAVSCESNRSGHIQLAGAEVPSSAAIRVTGERALS